MSTAENKAIVRRLFEEGWMQGNLDVMDEVYATGYIRHAPSGDEHRTPDDAKQFIVRIRTIFPDIHIAIEDQIAEGDKVVTRESATGTYKLTGEQVTRSRIVTHRLADGKIVEVWQFFGGPTETEQVNMAITRRFFAEVWNKGNLAVVDEVVAAEHIRHDPQTPDAGNGPDAVKQLVTQYRAAFPDLHFTLDDLIAAGDKVIARWTGHGTQTGDLPHIPATDKRVITPGLAIFRFASDKIADEWESYDALPIRQQLGVIPTPER